MKTVQINLYDYAGLNEKAREAALNHFRNINLDDDWWDCIFDDFIVIANFIGVSVQKDTIAFNGFYSQGDGSGFSASVELKALINGITSGAWKQYAPKLELNFTSAKIDRRVLKLALNKALDLEPRVIKRSRCYGVVADFGGYPFWDKKNHDLIYGEIDNLEKWLESIASVLNKYLYTSLRDEYEGLTSDFFVTETILSNGYLFTADGKFANRLEKLALSIV